MTRPKTPCAQCSKALTKVQLKRYRDKRTVSKTTRGPFCSRQCAGNSRRLKPVPCIECGKLVSGMRLSKHQWRRRIGEVEIGPFCSSKCSADKQRIYPDERTCRAVWELKRRAEGICIECGDKHKRGTYRCIKCTQKSARRQGHNHQKSRCGFCHVVGHTRPTCEKRVVAGLR